MLVYRFGDMRKVSKASEHHKQSDFNFQTVTINNSTDIAIIRIHKYGWTREYSFKVKNYSKGQANWKIIEDEEVKEKE